MGIKRSVSLYSFQDKYARKKMSLEDCLAKVKECGAEGVELISDQMIHKSPYPEKETIAHWRGLLDKYELVPVCNDIFINSTLYHNRRLTRDEELELLIQELRNAHDLGFDKVRLVSNTRADIIKPAMPYAKKYNVAMGLEIHAGLSIDHPLTMQYLKVMKEIEDPEYCGIVIDCGIYSKSLPPIARRYFEQFGLSQPLADRLDEIFEKEGVDLLTYFAPAGQPKNYDNSVIPEEIKKLIKTPLDHEYFIMSKSYDKTPFELMDQYMPYLLHIHGKCYEMTEDCREVSIMYPEFIEYLKKMNYDRYISTEYEGNRFILLDEEIPDVQAVERHQKMLAELIG